MSTLKSESGANSSESVYGSYSFVRDRKPCKGNSSSLYLVPDAKCWLHHHGIERCYSHDQLNVLDPEMELLTSSCANRNAKAIEGNQLIEEYYCNNLLQEFESSINDDLLSNGHLMDLNSCNSPIIERPKKLCSDFDSNWAGLKKIEPWWHAADKGDLASLISQKSSHHIVNCDLPEVQTIHVEKDSGGYVNCLNRVKDRTTNGISVRMDKSLGKRGLMECMPQESDGQFSSKDSFSTAKVDSPDTQEPASDDLSRVQLKRLLKRKRAERDVA